MTRMTPEAAQGSVRIVAQKEFTEEQIKQIKDRKYWSKERKAKAVMMMIAYNMRSDRGDFDTY